MLADGFDRNVVWAEVLRCTDAINAAEVAVSRRNCCCSIAENPNPI